MDEISRGIATAALTLQSVLLQAMVSKGLLTRAEALEAVDKGLAAMVADPDDDVATDVAEFAHSCLEGVCEELAEMAVRS